MRSCVIESGTTTEAMMMDLLVQVVVAAAILVMVVLAVIAQDRRTSVRERNLRDASHRHWWNRTHGGH